MRVTALVLLSMMILAACTSTLDSSDAFRMIHPEDGWTRMSAPPIDSATMIAVDRQNEHIQKLLKDSRYRATWFQRGSKDYLVYFQGYRHGDNSDCGDQAFEFIWKDTHWEDADFNKLIVCG